MGLKVTFDSSIKVIEVTSAPVLDGSDWVVDIDVKKDIFSDGKEDWLIDDTLSKFRFPVATAGGDELPGSKSLGSTFFLEYGWKIRPYEADHVLRINGNLYSRDGSSPFTGTIGTYAVMIINTVSSLVDSTVQQLADIEYAAFNGGITYDELNGYAGTGSITNGANIGTPRAPSNNVYDARTIASTRGFTTGYVINDMTIPEYELDGTTPFTVTGFIFQGSGKDRTVITLPEISNVYKNSYLDAYVTGYLDGDNTLNGCFIENLHYIKGFIELCVLSDEGELLLSGSERTSILSCYSGPDGAWIDFGGSGQPLVVGDHSGSLKLKNKTGPEVAKIGLKDGDVKIDLTTVINGSIIVGGVGRVTDIDTELELRSGTYGNLTIQNDAINKGNISQAVWDEPISDHLTSGTTGRSIGIAQFAGAINLDIVNGVSGTSFPIGTERTPVNNIPDAITIATANGIETFRVHGNITAAGGPFTSYKVIGDNTQDTLITCVDLDCQGVVFENCSITGSFINDSYITTWNCVLEDVTDIEITAYSSSFGGIVRLISAVDNKSVFYDCYDNVPGIGIPDIQVNGCYSLGLWNWQGGIRLSNISTVDTVISAMITAGRLWVDETCVEGDIIVKGMADLRGETGGTTIDQDGLITGDKIAEYVWDEPIADHLLANTMGHQMYHQAYGGTVHVDTVNGVSGTAFPTGTSHQPCDNLDDALTIATVHYMTIIHVVGTLEIDGQDITGRTIAADSSVGNSVTITSMVNTGTCYFQDITVSGALSGSNRFTACVLGALTGFDGGAKNCLLTGDVEIVGSGANYFTECDTYVTGFVPKSINIGDNFLNIIKCRGAFNLTNYIGSSVVTCDFIAGSCVIDSSCISGMIVISGLVSLTDNSDPACVVIDGTITERGTADAVWNYEVQ